MIQGIELPAANPIPLVAEGFEWYSEAYYQTGYCQKFEPADRTALQILSDKPLTAEVALVDRHGMPVGHVAVSYPDSGIAGVYLAELRPDFSVLDFSPHEEPVCRLAGTVTAAGIQHTIRSVRPIRVGKVEASCFIRYTAKENANSIVFTTGIVFGLRVEGGFTPRSYQPASDDTVFKDERASFVSLKSTPYNLYTFRAGLVTGIPDWLHSILNQAFSCELLYVDGVRIAKTEESEWQANDIEGYDLRDWTITIAKATNTGAHALLPDKVAYWSGYLCQRQDTPLAYVFTFEDGTEAMSADVDGQPVRVTLTSLRESTPFEPISLAGIPPWVSVTRSGFTFTVSCAPGDGSMRSATLRFVQGESGKEITLTVTQLPAFRYNPFVAHKDDGVTGSVLLTRITFVEPI